MTQFEDSMPAPAPTPSQLAGPGEVVPPPASRSTIPEAAPPPEGAPESGPPLFYPAPVVPGPGQTTVNPDDFGAGQEPNPTGYPDADRFDLVRSVFDDTDLINEELIPSAGPITSSYFDVQDHLNHHPVP